MAFVSHWVLRLKNRKHKKLILVKVLHWNFKFQAARNEIEKKIDKLGISQSWGFQDVSSSRAPPASRIPNCFTAYHSQFYCRACCDLVCLRELTCRHIFSPNVIGKLFLLYAMCSVWIYIVTCAALKHYVISLWNICSICMQVHHAMCALCMHAEYWWHFVTYASLNQCCVMQCDLGRMIGYRLHDVIT